LLFLAMFGVSLSDDPDGWLESSPTGNPALSFLAVEASSCITVGEISKLVALCRPVLRRGGSSWLGAEVISVEIYIIVSMICGPEKACTRPYYRVGFSV
jgi:hypothetical protein